MRSWVLPGPVSAKVLNLKAEGSQYFLDQLGLKSGDLVPDAQYVVNLFFGWAFRHGWFPR